MTRKGNKYHAINSAINEQFSSLIKVTMYFVCAMSTGQSKKSRESHSARFTLSMAKFRTVGFFSLQAFTSLAKTHKKYSQMGLPFF